MGKREKFDSFSSLHTACTTPIILKELNLVAFNVSLHTLKYSSFLQVRDLRDDLRDNFRDNFRDNSRDNMFSRVGVKGRLDTPRPPTPGYKLTVKNFPSSMSQSEFYSMFVRKGEVLKCEVKNNFGIVVYKTKSSAIAAVKDLNGTKNGSMTLSVREAPRDDPEPRRVDHCQGGRPERFRDRDRDIPIAPPPPSGIFSRLGDRERDLSRMDLRASSSVMMGDRFGGGRTKISDHFGMGGMEERGHDFSDSYQRMNMMPSLMDRPVDVRHNMDCDRRRMNNFEDEDARFHDRMMQDDRSSLSNMMYRRSEGAMENMGMGSMNMCSRNLGMSSSQGIGGLDMGLMSSRGMGGMNMSARNQNDLSVGPIGSRNFMGTNMGMKNNMIGGTLTNEMSLNVQGYKRINRFENFDDLSNPFGSKLNTLSSRKRFSTNMTPDGDFSFRSSRSFMIGDGGRSQGSGELDSEDNTYGDNIGISSFNRRDNDDSVGSFGGSSSRVGFAKNREIPSLMKNFGESNMGGGGGQGPWGRNRGGGGEGHSTWSN